jgi:group II intron reverse transcriptase/maturase
MGKLAKRIEDGAVLKLIRGFLQAGIMQDGLCQRRVQGTPQGGPLSPLLANFLLDEVDKMLEARGHAFVRYADDLNVYLRSERAAVRVLEALRKKLQALRLSVNETKTKIVSAKYNSEFLGFRVSGKPGGGLRWIVSRASITRFKGRVRELTLRNQGRALADVIKRLVVFLRGWKAYFRLAQTPSTFKELDGWIRRRLRAFILRQWCTSRTIYRRCRALGADVRTATSIASFSGRWWRGSLALSSIVLNTRFFDARGLPRLSG